MRIDVRSAGDGIGIIAEGAPVSVGRSTIRADGFSLGNGLGYASSSIDAATSQLVGPVRPAVGTVRCVLSHRRDPDKSFMNVVVKKTFIEFQVFWVENFGQPWLDAGPWKRIRVKQEVERAAHLWDR